MSQAQFIAYELLNHQLPCGDTGTINSYSASDVVDSTNPHLSQKSLILNDQPCTICGDRATGKHYGAQSCDGCKGFFRRSIRKGQHFDCQKNSNCLIDREKRTQCRSCRLQKCFNQGMKREAVQTERDKIRSRRSPHNKSESSDGISMTLIMEAEQKVKILLKRRGSDSTNTVSHAPRLAKKEDICCAMESQLNFLIPWALSLPCYSSLDHNDQSQIIKSQIGELLILSVLWSTLQSQKENILVLKHDCIVSGASEDDEIDEIFRFIMTVLLTPLQKLYLNEMEYVALKTIAFLSPSVRGISSQAAESCRQFRRSVHIELMNYMNDNEIDDNLGRFGEALLILPGLREASNMLVSKLNIDKSIRNNIDDLLSDPLNNVVDTPCDAVILSKKTNNVAKSKKLEPSVHSTVSSTSGHLLNSNPSQHNFSFMELGTSSLENNLQVSTGVHAFTDQQYPFQYAQKFLYSQYNHSQNQVNDTLQHYHLENFKNSNEVTSAAAAVAAMAQFCFPTSQPSSFYPTPFPINQVHQSNPSRVLTSETASYNLITSSLNFGCPTSQHSRNNVPDNVMAIKVESPSSFAPSDIYSQSLYPQLSMYESESNALYGSQWVDNSISLSTNISDCSANQIQMVTDMGI